MTGSEMSSIIGIVFLIFVAGLGGWFLRIVGIWGPVSVRTVPLGPLYLLGKDNIGPTDSMWALAQSVRDEVFHKVGVVASASFVIYYGFDETGQTAKTFAGCLIRPQDIDFIAMAPEFTVHEAPQGTFFQIRLFGRIPFFDMALWELPYMGPRLVLRCRRALINEAHTQGFQVLPIVEILSDDGSLYFAMNRNEDRIDPSTIEITWEELEAAYGGHVPPIEDFEQIDPKTLPLVERLYYRFFVKK